MLEQCSAPLKNGDGCCTLHSRDEYGFNGLHGQLCRNETRKCDPLLSAFSVQVYQSQLHTIENLCIVNSQFCTFIAFEFPVVDVIKHCFQLVGYFPLERGGRSFVSHPFMPAILTATTVASDACAALRFVPHIRYSIGSSSSDGDSTCVSFFKRLVTTTYPATPTATHRRAQAFVRVVVSSP